VGGSFEVEEAVKMTTPVEELKGFNPAVQFYLTRQLVSASVRQCEKARPEDRVVGFLLGETFVVGGKDYVVAKHAVADLGEVDSVGDGSVVVGIFYSSFAGDPPGVAKEMEQRAFLPSGEYYFVAAVDTAAETIKIMKKAGNIFIKGQYIEIDRAEVQSYDADRIIEDVSELRKTRMDIEFLSLMFLAMVFAVFGGAIGLWFMRKRDLGRAVLLFVVGIVSALAWMMIGHGIM
jgi:hypothetical protein